MSIVVEFAPLHLADFRAALPRREHEAHRLPEDAHAVARLPDRDEFAIAQDAVPHLFPAEALEVRERRFPDPPVFLCSIAEFMQIGLNPPRMRPRLPCYRTQQLIPVGARYLRERPIAEDGHDMLLDDSRNDGASAKRRHVLLRERLERGAEGVRSPPPCFLSRPLHLAPLGVGPVLRIDPSLDVVPPLSGDLSRPSERHGRKFADRSRDKVA